MNYKECKVEEISNRNPALIKSVPRDKKRDTFYLDIDKLNTNELTKKYERKISIHKKIIEKGKSITKKISRI